MEAAFHSTSHLGPCNVDRLIPYTPLSMRRHLELYRNAGKNKMERALQTSNGDMWARGWEQYKEYSDQIALMDAEVIGRKS
jgi:hypothetical protein